MEECFLFLSIVPLLCSVLLAYLTGPQMATPFTVDDSALKGPSGLGQVSSEEDAVQMPVNAPPGAGLTLTTGHVQGFRESWSSDRWGFVKEIPPKVKYC